MEDDYTKIYDSLIIIVTNIVCVILSLMIAVFMRHGLLFGKHANLDSIELLYHVIFVALLVNLCFDFNSRFFRRGTVEELFSTLKQQAILSFATVFWLYLIHQATSLSRLIFVYFFIVGTILTFLAHVGIRQFLKKVIKSGRGASRLIILTTSQRAEEALHNILSYNEWFRKVSGVVLMDEATPSGESFREGRTLTAEKVPVVADSSCFMDYVLRHEVDEVFILDNIYEDFEHFVPWIGTLEEMGIRVSVNIELFDLNVRGKKDLGQIGKYAVVSIHRNFYSPRQALAKRILDIIGSIVGLLILAVLSIFIVPAIKLDSPGPALYKQQRVGRNGRIFTLYKFRSMYVDADERKASLRELNEVTGPMFKIENDPRITKVGRFLRRTSLDEWPQFWNVLKGDMSLVGTRPPTIDEYNQYEARHKCRLSMTPGITGMWQVAGRSQIKDFDEVVALDMSYIDDWSLSKDIAILIRTLKAVVLGTGAK